MSHTGARSMFLKAKSRTRLYATMLLGGSVLQLTGANFGPSGLDGAGFQTCIGVDPFTGYVICCADTAGFSKSPDGDVFLCSRN